MLTDEQRQALVEFIAKINAAGNVDYLVLVVEGARFLKESYGFGRDGALEAALEVAEEQFRSAGGG